jgi:hypothetical protein
MKFAALVNGFGKFAERLTDGFWYYVLLNPVAWLLVVFWIVAVHWNNKLQEQLDTVCDAIEIPEGYDFPDKPKTDLEKAQYVCAAREQDRDIDMPQD